MSISETLLYAGYGANRDLEMITAIVGDAPKVVGSVAIQGVELCVQTQDQITRDISDTAPAPLSPKQVIDRAWGEKSGFETYAIRPQQSSSVNATLFELTQMQRDLIAEWELVEFGWYNQMSVSVVLEDGSQVQAVTEGFAEGQDVDRVIDGNNYETFLADPVAMFSTAEKARLDYLEQLEK
jgi:hypothetical protein